MYRKLLPLLNKFVCVRQGMFSRYYIGRLVSVEPDAMEIQTYHHDGTDAELWTVNLETVTEFSVNSKELNTLALKVKWARSASPEMDEESEANETEAEAPISE